MANWVQQIVAADGFWTESRKRLAFAGILILIGLATFIEVVLIPGALIRHPVAVPANEAVQPDPTDRAIGNKDPHPKAGVVESLLESAETKRMRAEAIEAAARKAIKGRLAEAQAQLTEARAAAAREWETFVGDVQRRHQVKIDAVPFDARSQPQELNQVILSDKTAAAAWAAIRSLASQANSEFAGIDASIRDLNSRLEQDTFAAGDGPRQQALLTAVQTMRGRIKQGNRDLDHIDVQVRARNFSNHNSIERNEQ